MSKCGATKISERKRLRSYPQDLGVVRQGVLQCVVAVCCCNALLQSVAAVFYGVMRLGFRNERDCFHAGKILALREKGLGKRRRVGFVHVLEEYTARVLHCVALRCSVLQCVAVCCSE